MNEISLTNIVLITLAANFLNGLMVILSAFVTGWLVYRAKRESYEPLISVQKQKATGKPINIDEFRAPDDPDNSSLPDAISLRNRIFGTRFATDSLKEKKN